MANQNGLKQAKMISQKELDQLANNKIYIMQQNPHLQLVENQSPPLNANLNMPTSQIKKPTVKSRLKSGANIEKLNPSISTQN